jgi:transposase InsO family protein
MALKVMTVAEMRLELLLEAARSGESVAAVCRRHGISRETFYVYKRRFLAEGPDGLEPRPKTPLRQPRRMAADVEDQICRMRKEHPRWGARRIKTELARAGFEAPAISSIHRAMVRNDLVVQLPQRPRPALLRFERATPNDLWQIDATLLRLVDGEKVWVMDILDDHARFCLAARVGDGPTGQAAWNCFAWAAARYGLPTQLLSDNGSCFTGRLKDHEVEFERRLSVLGVKLIHSRPYHPQTLGKLERFHRTLKEWLKDEPAARSPVELQEQLDNFRRHYNEKRPHQGIEDATPAERYRPGTPEVLPVPPEDPPVLPSPRGAILRWVNRNGAFSYRGFAIGVGKAWARYQLRIVEVEGVVQVFHGDELIRALVLDPNRSFQGTGHRPISPGRARKGAR